MRPQFWRVEEIWPGQTAVIVGGGPSLGGGRIFAYDDDHPVSAQVEFCRNKARVCVINNAYLLAPWADLHYASDARWYGWHAERAPFRAFAGLKATIENWDVVRRVPGLRTVRNYGTPERGPGLCELRDGVFTGRHSGYQLINILVHAGIKRIVLLGFDMRAIDGHHHWHAPHPCGDPAPHKYEKVFRPLFPALVEPLRRRGVTVLNATPGSALDCFPKVDLACALSSSSASIPTIVATASAAA